MNQVNFETTIEEDQIIHKIAKRGLELYKGLGVKRDLMDIEMDITAVHLNDCELQLQKLLDADDFNFAHDVMGIRRHIDRATGKLQNCFLPRCSA